MNCWVFLLIFCIRTVTYKLPQPRPPGFPPPVGRSLPGVSDTAFPFSICRRNPDTQQKFPIVQAFVLYHIFQAVNWIRSPAMNCWVFLLIFYIRKVTYKLPQPRPPGFPPRVGRSPRGVSNAAFPFSDFSKKSRRPTEFPHCTGVFVLPHLSSCQCYLNEL